jgi:hypothetical protein
VFKGQGLILDPIKREAISGMIRFKALAHDEEAG